MINALLEKRIAPPSLSVFPPCTGRGERRRGEERRGEERRKMKMRKEGKRQNWRRM
jgi:hypothetical protein